MKPMKITAADKQRALEKVLFSPDFSDQDFRVFCYLLSAMDRTTGLVKRKQRTIAEHLHRGGRNARNLARSIQISINRLVAGGVVGIDAHPSGRVNAYRIPAIEKANEHSPSAEKRRMDPIKKANGHGQKGEAPFVPILPFSPNLSLRTRETGANALAGLGDALTRTSDPDKVVAWFRDAMIADVSSDTLTIETPHVYARTKIVTEFEEQILTCCKTLAPSIRRVVVSHRKAAA